MFIQQFRYSADNLGYLLYSEKEGMAVDAGAVDEILAFARKNNVHIKYVTNTHFHHDHTTGNEAMLQKTAAQFIDCRQIKSDQTVALDTEIVDVFPTPGHTNDSVTFRADDFLLTGDTLFNGTVGNCFTGDLKSFFNSIKRLISYPKNTRIYGGHDYVIESMKIAKTIEKDNLFIDAYLEKYSPRLIVSTLGDELKANLYIRFNAPEMIQNLQEKKMPLDTEFDRFNSIMEIY